MNFRKREERVDMFDKNELKFAWLPKSDKIGERLFTFDGKQMFNLFRDYPRALTPEQKKAFDEANPFWADFFKDRSYKNDSDG